MECLTKASNSKYVSIVFCALGTGNLCYPRDAVAKILYNCVREFDESNTSVKDVRFLCYMHDTKTVQAFEIEEMNQWREYYQHTGDRGISKWPQEWEDQGSRNLKAFRLLNTSLEYKTVENKFIESVFNGRPEWSAQFNKQTFKVTKIERVQNVSLYDMYKGEKALLENQNPEGTKNELELWHGTPNTTVNMINSYGFKQFHKSTKELKWDEGVYFTADASHAAMKGMTTAHAADEQCIYLCKVLTGVHCKREIGMLELPFRQDGTMLKFDSAADDKYDPVAGYIIFNFKQAYPQYCIKYKY